MPVNETENTVGAIQDWLNLKEAAQFLSVTISMVMALVERGALDTLGHGRFTQISKKSLDAIKTYQVQGNVAVEDSPAKYSLVAEVRPLISPEQALRAKGKTDLLKQINRLQAQRLEDQRQVGLLDTQLQILKQEVEILELQHENLRLMRENLQHLQNNPPAKKRWWR